MTTRGAKSRLTRIKEFFDNHRSLYLVVGFFYGILGWHFVDYWLQSPEQLTEFFQNLVPEFVGIVFTVLIIDTLDRQRENRLIKEQLLRQLHSYYNPVALQSIEEMRIMGYLSDGSCRGLDLRGADWRGANLYQADLQDADLRNAKLEKADLVEATLRNVKISDEQLVLTDIMWKCVMPDGSLYDGRFNLPHDFEVAVRKNFNPQDPESMAAYYGVPLERYVEGQTWAAEHLEPLRNKAKANRPSA